jgi:glyoxylase-like metal-dependent hydrolase (beta-lactamase superfamily II)
MAPQSEPMEPEPPVQPIASVDGTLFRVELASNGRRSLIRWSTPVAPQIYDAYALPSDGGPVLIDPQVASTAVWDQLVTLLERRPVATVLTSSWHERSAYWLREQFGIPVWLPAAGTQEMEGRPDHLYRAGEPLPGQLKAITVDPTFAGDTVLWWQAPNGERVLFSGDVILGQLKPQDVRADHWRRDPGTYLWLHGRGDRARFHAAFRPVLEEPFDLICSAHSVVLRAHPKGSVSHLLEAGRVIDPTGRGQAVALVPPEWHAE